MERAVSLALTYIVVQLPLPSLYWFLLWYLPWFLPCSQAWCSPCPSCYLPLSRLLCLPCFPSALSTVLCLCSCLSLTPLCVCRLGFCFGLCFALPVAACPQRFQFDKHPGGVQKRPFVKRLLPQLLQLLLLLCNVSSLSHAPSPTIWAIS